MTAALLALLTSVTLASLPRPDVPSDSDDDLTPDLMSSRTPSLSLLINRSLAAEKAEEREVLRDLEKKLNGSPSGESRHALLRVQAILASLREEEQELNERCVELASSADEQLQQSEWTPHLSLDAETLASLTATQLGLSPEAAVEMHEQVHRMLARISHEDARLERFGRDVLRPARESLRLAATGVGASATPLEVVDAADFVAEQEQAEVALRVQRELDLQRLAQFVGLDLSQSAKPLSCPASAQVL